MADKHWYDHSLIPPAYHVRPPGAEKQAQLHEHRAVRLGELTGGAAYRFTGFTEAEQALERELLENRRELARALELAAQPSTLASHPHSNLVRPNVDAPLGASSSVLAFAAASVPMGSSADPLPLGAQLVFPAARPNERKQVGHLFFAIEAMLKEVGKDTEKHRLAAAAVVASAQAQSNKASSTAKKLLLKEPTSDLAVPSLFVDIATYASWCGLSSTAATSASQTPAAATPQLLSPVADLAVGSFLHTPSAPAPPMNLASVSSPSSSLLSSSTLDLRFQTDVETLQRFAVNDNATSKKDKSHEKLTTVMQELSVYLVAMHELARQEWMSCQERGDLLHLLVQRCAVITQALLPLAQREVVQTVAQFKGQIHQLLAQQEAKFNIERSEWQKINTRTSVKLIAMKEELKTKNLRVKELEAEVDRYVKERQARRIECTETDRLQRTNSELTEQLKAMREQVAAAMIWRAEQQLTLEQLHFSAKAASERRTVVEDEIAELKLKAAEDKVRYEQNLLDMQARFLELRIPDEADPKLKKEVHAMMEERARDVEQLKNPTVPAAAESDALPSSAKARRARRRRSMPSAISERGASSERSSQVSSDVESETASTPSASSRAASRRNTATHMRVSSMLGAMDFGADVEDDEHDDSDRGGGGSDGDEDGENRGHARSMSAANSSAFAALLRNTRVEYSNQDVDLYLLTRSARFYRMVVTKKQVTKLHQLQAEKKKSTIKLPGQIGPKDWLVNFCWSVLKRRAEYDAVSDCYQQPRQPFPEFLYHMLLHHETVKGSKSVFLSVVWTVLRSLIKYKNTCHLAALLVDLIEEVVPLDGLNFLMAVIGAMQSTSIGIDYGPGRFGSIRWVCTLRTRHINGMVLQKYPDSALKELNDIVDANSEGMSLAEIKQHQAALAQRRDEELAQRRAAATAAKNGKEPVQTQQMKQLTKIDYGKYLKLAGRHYNKQWKQQVENVKNHFKASLDKQNKKFMNFPHFTTFVRQLVPTLDSRHIQQLYSDAAQFAKADGVKYEDFKSAGGLQLLVQDYARIVYQQSDWSVLRGDKELLSCIDSSWLRLRPVLQPLMELASTERTLLSSILSERLHRLESRIDALRLSLLHNVTSRRVRDLVKAFREVVYETYGFLRYREEFGAMIKIKNPYEHSHQLSSPLRSDQPPSATIFAPTPGPNAAYLADEVNSLLFMIQRELLSFCAPEPLPQEDMLHDE